MPFFFSHGIGKKKVRLINTRRILGQGCKRKKQMDSYCQKKDVQQLISLHHTGRINEWVIMNPRMKYDFTVKLDWRITMSSLPFMKVTNRWSTNFHKKVYIIFFNLIMTDIWMAAGYFYNYWIWPIHFINDPGFSSSRAGLKKRVIEWIERRAGLILYYVNINEYLCFFTILPYSPQLVRHKIPLLKTPWITCNFYHSYLRKRLSFCYLRNFRKTPSLLA